MWDQSCFQKKHKESTGHVILGKEITVKEVHCIMPIGYSTYL